MEKEKIALQNSRDRLNIELEEMTNRETSLSNKIRTLENDNIVLEGKVVQLEYADSAAQDRIKDLERRNTDLENRNESALMKVHQLEETKANLKFEVSDLQIQLQEFQQEVEKAGDVESSLKKQIVALQTTSRNMQDSLSDTSAREMELLNKLQEHEQHEAVLKEKIVALESSELKLKYKIQELGATVSTAENRVTTAKNLEEENHLLHRQIDDQQRKVRNLDQEIQTLNEKLVAYENPGKSNGFVRVLAKELSELRAQKAWVEEAEKTVTRLEKSEARLKETVQQLREGKDVCGHEGELKDLKDEVNRLKALEKETSSLHRVLLANRKAYDMLQDNYSKLRENFTILYQGVKSGDVKLENITLPPDIKSPDSNLTPRSQAIVDFVDQLPLEDIPLLSAVAPSMSSPAGPGVIEEMEWKQIENTNKSSTSKLAELSDLWGHIEKTTAVSSAPSESGPAPAVPSSKPPTIPGKATHADGSVIEDSFYLPSTQVPEGDVDSADEAPSLAEDIPLSGRAPPPLPKSKPPSPPTSGVTGSVSTPATPPKGYRPPVPPKPPTPSWLKRRSHIDQLNPDVILLERVHAKEIKDWETRVEGLEKKLKNKESELSLFKDSLPASGAKGSSDLAMWKAKLRDRERQLEVKEKIVKDQRDQILKLEKELAEKRRELTFAQEEISRLDRLVRSKNLVGPDSPLPSLHRMQRERLANTGRTSEKNMLDWLETSREEHQLKKELQNKEQELFSKNIEIDQLNKKLKDKQEKVERLEAELKQHKTPEKSGMKSREASPPEGSLSAKISPSRTEEDGQSVTGQAQLEAEQKELRIRLNNTLEELRDKKEELSKASNTMTPLRAKVTRLAKKCKQKDNLLHRAAKDMSNCGMHGRLVSKIEHELETSSNGSDRRSSEKFSSCSSSPPKKAKKSNTKNDSHDHQTTDDQTEMDSMVWSLDDHSDHSGETSVATASDFDDLPYTTRVKSKHGQLNNERIKRHPTEPRQRTSEKKRKSKHSKQKPHGGEDTDLFRAVSDYRPELFSQSRHPNLELPLKEGELVQVLGPPDQDGYYETRLGGRVGLVPASYLQPVYTERTVDDSRRERSRPGELALPSHLDTSPEQILGMHSALEQAFHPGPYPIGHGFETGDNMVEQQLPVNLALSLSQSLQLPPPSIMNQNLSPFNQLQPQQQQTTNGQPSLGNYLQAVPSNDLLSPNGASLRNGQGPVDQQQAYSALPGSNFPSNSNNTDRRSNNSYHPTNRSRVGQRTAGNPDPPSQFSMEQILSDLSVLLSWQPPEMDEFGRNNDSIVKGYKILVNGREAEVVRSPHQCKVLIENQNLRRPVQFSIQTLAENGRMSATTDLMLGEFPRAASRNSMPPHSATEEDGDVDDDDDVASFVSNDDHYRKGERRIFVAVYDYIPSRQSPNKVSAYELVIKAGDVITTFGLQRADGFFFAEVNGRRGLVPASFIEEFSAIQKSNSNLVSRKAGKLSSHKNSEHSSSEQSNVSTGSRSKGQPKRMEKYKDTRL
ncbi:formin BNR1-like [Lingula anatina]|uniref:Formin BNR1-like n=1 Tax=Lingula anatina TaxID=7574 RepID=A0A1S3IMT0_LINAN|nr:formin BNR1-like [Lingula anatina]|eukprot:XP_013399507.1 formin BNR1-like [Lingula anatina]